MGTMKPPVDIIGRPLSVGDYVVGSVSPDNLAFASIVDIRDNEATLESYMYSLGNITNLGLGVAVLSSLAKLTHIGDHMVDFSLPLKYSFAIFTSSLPEDGTRDFLGNSITNDVPLLRAANNLHETFIGEGNRSKSFVYIKNKYPVDVNGILLDSGLIMEIGIQKSLYVLQEL